MRRADLCETFFSQFMVKPIERPLSCQDAWLEIHLPGRQRQGIRVPTRVQTLLCDNRDLMQIN